MTQDRVWDILLIICPTTDVNVWIPDYRVTPNNPRSFITESSIWKIEFPSDSHSKAKNSWADTCQRHCLLLLRWCFSKPDLTMGAVRTRQSGSTCFWHFPKALSLLHHISQGIGLLLADRTPSRGETEIKTNPIPILKVTGKCGRTQQHLVSLIISVSGEDLVRQVIVPAE